ncbi:MAG TPA: PaaI family thioesterase [Candidatus Limnocylindrales bacterium]|nr:PaaI family thioesterase [Candidatus Limnocylindrales bacterium]
MNEGRGPSLQERFAPQGRCFGCGPANEHGLRISTRPSADQPGTVATVWHAGREHEAFAGVVNGGICGTLLDCTMNWAAVGHLVGAGTSDVAPDTVTAQLSIEFLAPTPSDRPIVVRGRVVRSDGHRVLVEGSIEVDGVASATARGTFVTVGRDHPAFGRWRG